MTPAKSRWRFSLRTLLFVTLTLGCGLGWLARESQRANRQRAAVALIRGVGGHAHYDYQLNHKSDWPGERLLRRFAGSDFLCQVQAVSIHHARDQDLQALSDLSGLEDLRLNSQHVTDKGLSPLKSLRSLKRLDLWCEQISDQGIRNLGELRELETLDLYGTQVTDAGLAHLRGLTSLRVLKLRDTRVTSEGVASLQKLLPDCKISQ